MSRKQLKIAAEGGEKALTQPLCNKPRAATIAPPRPDTTT